jgi:hypothetical protein
MNIAFPFKLKIYIGSLGTNENRPIAATHLLLHLLHVGISGDATRTRHLGLSSTLDERFERLFDTASPVHAHRRTRVRRTHLDALPAEKVPIRLLFSPHDLGEIGPRRNSLNLLVHRIATNRAHHTHSTSHAARATALPDVACAARTSSSSSPNGSHAGRLSAPLSSSSRRRRCPIARRMPTNLRIHAHPLLLFVRHEFAARFVRDLLHCDLETHSFRFFLRFFSLCSLR